MGEQPHAYPLTLDDQRRGSIIPLALLYDEGVIDRGWTVCHRGAVPPMVRDHLDRQGWAVHPALRYLQTHERQRVSIRQVLHLRGTDAETPPDPGRHVRLTGWVPEHLESPAGLRRWHRSGADRA